MQYIKQYQLVNKYSLSNCKVSTPVLSPKDTGWKRQWGLFPPLSSCTLSPASQRGGGNEQHRQGTNSMVSILTLSLGHLLNARYTRAFLSGMRCLQWKGSPKARESKSKSASADVDLGLALSYSLTRTKFFQNLVTAHARQRGVTQLDKTSLSVLFQDAFFLTTSFSRTDLY